MESSARNPDVRTTDVVVIGAGQAGLSAAYHLRRRGLEFVILDAEDGPGGAWRHRWDSLTMATVNGIRELPGMPEVAAEAAAPSNRAVPAYFADFEERFEVPVERPVRVTLVEDDPAAAASGDDAPDPARTPLLVHSVGPDGTRRAPIRARAVFSATGTWTRPFVPAIPGADSFRGRRLHTVDYVRAEDFAGQRVAVVGGGISALGFLQEIAEVGETLWYTRREPVFGDGPFTHEAGRQVIAGVIDRVRQGRPAGSVVSNTGLRWTPELREAARRGVLRRRPMFERITETGLVEADGTTTELDAILWATGFRHELRHLRRLGLRSPLGGIALDGTAAAADPRIHLLGYGPSASTIGANRAGRAAVTALLRTFEREDVPV
ncbi:pyridine nucleotide-disulfide oxidoreductase [Brachybacterium sp. P6-10-X1]|uniref:FAD-dependent oxidoreductase n=1 Tax=Brachybacterium sp. P6-10-X1 TaxID=1903186 RepID=UPI00097196A9|nr:FAD-dependent oxidoreductase [Brachybacterium sp. P6-10-X1]APX32101.1 pyridine nucleotide-disulfide oxidoreductase [Brachybacterium sp. P6-10-X1]